MEKVLLELSYQQLLHDSDTAAEGVWSTEELVDIWNTYGRGSDSNVMVTMEVLQLLTSRKWHSVGRREKSLCHQMLFSVEDHPDPDPDHSVVPRIVRAVVQCSGGGGGGGGKEDEVDSEEVEEVLVPALRRLEESGQLEKCLEVCLVLSEHRMSHRLSCSIHPVLVSLVTRALQSDTMATRIRALHVLGSIAIASGSNIPTILNVLTTAVCYETDVVRLVALKVMWDVVYLYPVTQEAQLPFLTQFIHSASVSIQITTSIGICRLLLSNYPSANESERMLALLLERLEEPKVAAIIASFLEKYADSHQTELANALVYITIEIFQNATKNGELKDTWKAKEPCSLFKAKAKLLLGFLQSRLMSVIIESILSNLYTVLQLEVSAEDVKRTLGINKMPETV